MPYRTFSKPAASVRRITLSVLKSIIAFYPSTLQIISGNTLLSTTIPQSIFLYRFIPLTSAYKIGSYVISRLVKNVVERTLIDMKESRETHTAASIGLLLEQLKAIVASVEASKILLETAEVPSVEVQRASSRVRGTNELQGFADALRDVSRSVAMKSLQDRAAALSDLSGRPKNGTIHGDSSEQKETKRKAADKGSPPHKSR